MGAPYLQACRRAVLVWALLLPAWGGASLAQGVRATIDRGEIALDQQVRLTVTIEGSQRAQPQLPDLPDFRVVSRGTSQQMSVVNGQATVSASHEFILIPSRPGRFTVGPVTAEIDGRTYSSQALAVTVLEEGREPQEQPEAFLTVSVSDDEPFVGEQVLYTWRFYRRVRVLDASLTSLEFGDLSVEELGDVREYDDTVEGVPYRVSELRRALFAQRPGTLEIPPAVLTCEFAVQQRRGSFFDFGRVRSESRVLRSRPLTLQVRPLPAPPPDFSGLVGDFDIRATLSRNELSVGESATWELRVDGVGNIQMLREPALPDLGAFKVYEDQPVTRVDRSGSSLRGSRTYRKALVPLAPGDLSLPPVRLVTFDPETARFETRATRPLDMQVAPSEDTEDLMLTENLGAGQGKVAVRVLADDILPIRTDLERLRRSRVGALEVVLWGGLAILPPLAVALLLGWSRGRTASASEMRRRQRAFSRALGELEEIRGGSDGLETAAARASAVLRGFVGDKLGRNGDALTPAEVEEALCAAGVETDAATEAREALQRLEALVFGGDSRRFTPAQLAQSVETIVRELERQMGSGFGLDGRPGRWWTATGGER